MELNNYSPEPARAMFHDWRHDISKSAERTANALFNRIFLTDRELAEKNGRRLEGAALHSDEYADSNFLKFLSDTMLAYGENDD